MFSENTNLRETPRVSKADKKETTSKVHSDNFSAVTTRVHSMNQSVWRVCPMWYRREQWCQGQGLCSWVKRQKDSTVFIYYRHKHWLWLTQLQCLSVELKGFKDSLFSSKLKVGGRTSKSEHLSVFRRNKGNHKMRTLKLKTQKQWLLSLFCSELKMLFCFISSIIGHRTNGIEVIWLHWNEMS